MYKGIYITMSGMLIRENELASVSNNLANMNTTGYKRVSFASRLYPLLSGRPPEPRAIYQDSRTQTYFGTQYIELSQGNLRHTGNPLDLAIQGEGFFVVRVGDRNLYTRAGSFSRDKENYLVTQGGLRVLDENNNPILIEGNKIEIGKDGSIFVDGSQITRLNLLKIDNIFHVGNSFYDGIIAGQATGQILQGWIESSNVNPMNELVQMIQAIRNFDLTQRVTKNFDELAQKAVSEIARL
ncbi:MAG: flagellar basal-body rod protein FlgF [Thermodesulfovibrio sp.]|nr:flagellar basal-body rod protein FlgF [Thermodesulfovibrio sp.]